MDDLSLNLQSKVASTKRYLLHKRVVDLVVSLLLLMGIFPIMLFITLAILWDTGLPVIYRQERLGLGGRAFVMYKFRTMIDGAENQTGPVWAKVRDSRITTVGRVLRKLRLDELPQLFNVALGEMSLVGPRPERPVLSQRFSVDVPLFPVRLLVKPGLTGLAQVSGGYDMNPSEKLTIDIYYIEHLSWRMDLFIVLKTLYIVLTGHGSR